MILTIKGSGISRYPMFKPSVFFICVHLLDNLDIINKVVLYEMVNNKHISFSYLPSCIILRKKQM